MEREVAIAEDDVASRHEVEAPRLNCAPVEKKLAAGAALTGVLDLKWGAARPAGRLREYKAHVKVVLPQSVHMHIDLATVHDVGLAPWFFNLYLDPKEEMTVGHRLDPWMPSVVDKLKAHAARSSWA